MKFRVKIHPIQCLSSVCDPMELIARGVNNISGKITPIHTNGEYFFGYHS